MAAQKNILGFIDAGREVRRSPLVGMEFLHQRAVRAARCPRRSPPAAGQGSDRPPLPSFCRWAPRGPAPLPRHLSRFHAIRAPGGPDTPSVARGFPRRSRPSKPASVADIERVEVGALVAAGEDAAAHRAGVVIELHLDKGRAHPRGLPGALLRARAEAGDAPTAASRAGPSPAKPSGTASPNCAARPRNAAPPSAPMPPAHFTAGGELARIGVGESLAAHRAAAPAPRCRRCIGHRYLICASSLIAPASRRADRSASAFMPPAA